MSKCQAQKIQIPRDSDLLQLYGQLRNKPILHLSALSSKSYLHSLWDQILSWEQLYLRTFQLWAWILALVLSNTWDSVNIQTTKINTSLQAKVKAKSQVQRTSPRFPYFIVNPRNHLDYQELQGNAVPLYIPSGTNLNQLSAKSNQEKRMSCQIKLLDTIDSHLVWYHYTSDVNAFTHVKLQNFHKLKPFHLIIEVYKNLSI